MVEIQVIHARARVDDVEATPQGVALRLRPLDAPDDASIRLNVPARFGVEAADIATLAWVHPERGRAAVACLRVPRSGAVHVFEDVIRDACDEQAMVDHRRRGCLFGVAGMLAAGIGFGAAMAWWVGLLALPVGWIVGSLVLLLIVPPGVRAQDVAAVRMAVQAPAPHAAPPTQTS